jgi:hypothetical protein
VGLWKRERERDKREGGERVLLLLLFFFTTLDPRQSFAAKRLPFF